MISHIPAFCNKKERHPARPQFLLRLLFRLCGILRFFHGECFFLVMRKAHKIGPVHYPYERNGRYRHNILAYAEAAKHKHCYRHERYARKRSYGRRFLYKERQ